MYFCTSSNAADTFEVNAIVEGQNPKKRKDTSAYVSIRQHTSDTFEVNAIPEGQDPGAGIEVGCALELRQLGPAIR